MGRKFKKKPQTPNFRPLTVDTDYLSFPLIMYKINALEARIDEQDKLIKEVIETCKSIVNAYSNT